MSYFNIIFYSSDSYWRYITTVISKTFHYKKVILKSGSHSSLSTSVTFFSVFIDYIIFIFYKLTSKTKMIAVSEKTHKNLAQMGTLEDTFDTVIDRMIQKIATSGPKSYQEPGQIAATEPTHRKERTPLNE